MAIGQVANMLRLPVAVLAVLVVAAAAAEQQPQSHAMRRRLSAGASRGASLLESRASVGADFGAIPHSSGRTRAHAKFRDGPIADYSKHAQDLENVLDPYAGVNDFDRDFGMPRDAARFASVGAAIAAAGGAAAGVRTKQEGGNDKIECYNAHKLYQVGMLTSTAELCSLMVENLGEEFESSPAFQTECTDAFGEVCREECRDLGHLFDQSVYANKGGHDSYPADYHNQVKTYALKYWDCKNCLEFGSCFAGTQNLLADD